MRLIQEREKKTYSRRPQANTTVISTRIKYLNFMAQFKNILNKMNFIVTFGSNVVLQFFPIENKHALRYR